MTTTIPRLSFIRLLRFVCCFLLCARASAQWFVPPAEPEVHPWIGIEYGNDADRDAIDDALAARARQMRSLDFIAPTAFESAMAMAVLEAPVEVELVFKEQITQQQIDRFLAQGGQISHLYRAVSYGWNGRIPLSRIALLPPLLGASLVLVQESVPMQLHMDRATQTGRARPVWAAGFAGNVAGFDGDPSITIAIVDSGMDESHPDLAGRRVFWQDFSTDGAANPIDIVQHGSHVGGIAFGSGAAGGIGTGTLSFTHKGSLSGVPSGSFVPSPVELPASSVTATFVATWNGGGSTTLHILSRPKGATGWDTSHGSVTGTSPLTVSATFTGNAGRVYSPGLLSNGAMTDFVVRCQVTNYAGVGDGFNKMRGVAPGCNWAGAKVFTNSGSGTGSTLAAGVDTLVANRAAHQIKVMNLSLGIIGSPGLDATLRQKINTAVNNGIVVVASAGNDGGTQQVDDPGRAAMALTVAASNDVNQLTNYTSTGFASPGTTAGQEEDYKPDLMAPGGSLGYYSSILSVDSNSGDGTPFADQQANDYYNIQGTSMAAPFAAGCAALLIDALQQNGVTWDFASSQHSRYVKMLLCATASESNSNRESASSNPTLQRATAGANGFPVGKDQYEGYGMINPDAAIEAATVAYVLGTNAGDTFGGGVADRRVWARKVTLVANQKLIPTLTNPAGGDFDLHLYSNTPGTYGTPVLLASSTTAVNGGTETFTYTAPADTTVLLVVKRVSGSGNFSITAPPPPTLPGVAIASNNAIPSGAALGDTITLAITSSVPIQTPVVTIAGRAASVNGSGTSWTAGITVNGGDAQGIVPFQIAFQDLSSNPGTPVAATTNASSVTIDSATQTPTLTAPTTDMITANPVSVSFSLPETAFAGSVRLLFIGAASRTLTLAASQETSGPHSFTFNPANPTGSAQVASITGGATIPDGSYTITLSYQDALGNVAATTASTNVTIDTTPPTLSLPANITVTATSPTGATVNYTASASDPGGSGIASSNFAPASGSAFAIGVTTVNATATDNAGNVANGSFTVAVNPNPAPTGGTFTITPNAGVHQGDSLSLRAPGWSDPDAPLTYQFFNGATSLNIPGGASTLNISAPAPGSYTLKVRVTDAAGSFIEATQPLTVVPFTSVETWRQTYFGDYRNTGNGADNADPDLDGEPNRIEFAFGTNPTSGVSGPQSLQYTGTFAGGGTVTLAGQPTMMSEPTQSGVDLRALFVRRVDYVAAGLTYIVEFSADLSTWTASAVTPTVLADNGTVQIVSVPAPAFLNVEKRKIVRVRVVGPP